MNIQATIILYTKISLLDEAIPELQIWHLTEYTGQVSPCSYTAPQHSSATVSSLWPAVRHSVSGSWSHLLLHSHILYNLFRAMYVTATYFNTGQVMILLPVVRVYLTLQPGLKPLTSTELSGTVMLCISRLPCISSMQRYNICPI